MQCVYSASFHKVSAIRVILFEDKDEMKMSSR